MAQSPVRYGIIGYGSFAERVIAPAILQASNAKLVAIQKRSLASAQQKASSLGIPLAFDRAEKLVEHGEIDAVFIASANAMHCPETEIAAAAGKHVIVEKPMAMDRHECKRMIAACSKARVKLMVGHMVRLSPLVERIRSLVRQGAIGTVHLARADFMFLASGHPRTWFMDRALAGGGPVFDIGVHCLDTLRYVLGQEVASVSAQLSPSPTAERTEATAQIAMKFTGGAVGSIFCSFVAPVRRSFIRIMGSSGILSAEDFTVASTRLELHRHETREGKLLRESVEAIEVPNLYVREIEQFSECIVTGSEPFSPGENGLANQIVLDAIMEGRTDSIP